MDVVAIKNVVSIASLVAIAIEEATAEWRWQGGTAGVVGVVLQCRERAGGITRSSGEGAPPCSRCPNTFVRTLKSIWSGKRGSGLPSSSKSDFINVTS